MSLSYCVVGGGISGLVAAYRLRLAVGADATITVFDPADRLGGILRTVQLGGQLIDVGAEAFVARRPEVPALLAELDLAGRQIQTTGVRPLILSGGRLHPLPADTVNGIPSSESSVRGLVDEATLERMAAETRRSMEWRSGEDPAVGAVVADRFGEQVVARSVDPMLAGVYAGSAATIGIRSAVPAVAARLDAGAPNLTAAVRQVLPGSSSGPVFGAIDGGYQVLIDELVNRSGLRWEQTAVERIVPDGSGWVLQAGGQRWNAAGVVVAVPAPRLAGLLSEVLPATSAAAQRVKVASAVVLAIAVPGSTPLPQQSGVLVASGEQLHAKAITLTSRKWGTRGSLQRQHVQLLRMSFGRFGDEVARATSDEQLIDWAVADLAQVFGLTIDPVDILVQRWIDAMPQYGPGHLDLAAELRKDLPPGLALAGNYLDGVGVPACVASAGRAAAAVAEATARP